MALNTHSIDLDRPSNQYLYVSASELRITGDVTVEFWFKPENTSNDMTMVACGTSNETEAGNILYGIQMNETAGVGVLQYTHENGAGSNNIQTPSTGHTFTSGVWVHVAITRDVSEKRVRYYINGSYLGDSTYTNQPTGGTSSDFIIGDFGQSAGQQVSGKIDDVRVWNDVRTGTEISNNYKKQLEGNESGLVGYWKLNNSYDDETSNANDLTAVNSPVFSSDTPTFFSPSASQSPSSSPSLSPSPSPSSSPSASQSPSSSPSLSPSLSPSSSPSSSESRSPSASQSPSSSPSLSPSSSGSPSPSSSASSSESMSPSPTPSPGASCIIDQQQQNGNGWTAIAGTAPTPDRLAVAQTFQAGQTAKICNVKVALQKVGSPSGNVKCEIWSDSGGDPDELLDTADYEVDAVGLSTGISIVHFTFTDGAHLVSGNTYHIVLSPTGSYLNWDSSNEVNWFTQNSNSTDSYSSGKARYLDELNNWNDFSFYTYSDFYFAEYYDENTSTPSASVSPSPSASQSPSSSPSLSPSSSISASPSSSQSPSSSPSSSESPSPSATGSPSSSPSLSESRSPSASPSPSSSPSLSPSASPSPSSSESPSPSSSESRSPSLSPSLSGSPSPSSSISSSPSASESPSPSSSASPSSSVSLSPSPSSSPSSSISPSPSSSVSSSVSPSPSSSESPSPSATPSSSPSSSVSLSPSPSPSSSESQSPSSSPSASVSLSPSASESPSPSSSVSASISPSQAPGSGYYSYESLTSLPTTDADLAIIYGEEDETNVATDNSVYVPVTSDSNYLAHEFKKINNTNQDSVKILVNLKTSLAPSTTPVYLQVYNHNTDSWETIATDNTSNADTDFDLTSTLSSNMSYYYDSDYIVAFRVQQYINGVTHTMNIDYVHICFIILYADKYSDQSTSYEEKYESTNPSYSDKYSDQDTEYTDKYTVKRC